MLSPPKAGITGTRAIMHFGAGGAALPCARLTGRGYCCPGMEDRRMGSGSESQGRRGVQLTVSERIAANSSRLSLFKLGEPADVSA